MPDVTVRRLAQADVREAALWYENQRPGSGTEFTLQFDALMERIAQNPLQFPEIGTGYAALFFDASRIPSTFWFENGP